MAIIDARVKCSKRWFFWPVFYVVWAAYRLRMIDLTRAASITARGFRMEINR